MRYSDLISTLNYAGAPLFCEGNGMDLVALADRHWLRSARAAGARGTYLVRTSPEEGALRAAVHVAEAQTVEEARQIHARLWNQGVHPFVIIALPDQVRVFTGFAYHPDPHSKSNGEILPPSTTIHAIRKALEGFSADAINRGDIWRQHGMHLRSETRVDATLLGQLKNLSEILQADHGLPDRTVHSLIGKFVYLSYLRARDILSDKWLRDEADVEPAAVFVGRNFAPDLTLRSFRKVARAVETRFNGLLFPVPWGSPRGPRSDAIQAIARVFAGERILSGQLHLPFTAYDFQHIPVEFLSSIYEQFLHTENPDDEDPAQGSAKQGSDVRGAHYTPEPLVEYLVSEVNSVHPLRKGARIVDPCCGSGVFLVAAYRRLVEMECQRQQRSSLHATELRDILETSIFAVERNETACHIAAFSLILTLLSYVEPPELHARRNFKFPTLAKTNLFNHDFFDERGKFWQLKDPVTGGAMKYEWIIGNPPWVEIGPSDAKEKNILDWSNKHAKDMGLARGRTGEAFAFRVLDCLADGGVAGLILHAKTLTNDHLKAWRGKFFGGVSVHRVTNLANMAYVLFPSAQQPAVTLVYSRKVAGTPVRALLHCGPFVANQMALHNKARKAGKRRAWSISLSESEMKYVDVSQAASGEASVWKLALWGNQRDQRTVGRLQRVFSTNLGKIIALRGWHLELGLQLRKDVGTDIDNPNTYARDLEGLRVFDHDAFFKARRGTGASLSIPGFALVDNEVGCYVRGNRRAGVAIVTGPHVFLSNEFAALSEESFIICHDKIGLAASVGDLVALKAVAALWTSRFATYLLFFLRSAAWGVGYSTIDKGDAVGMPFPELTPERGKLLANVWDDAVMQEKNGAAFEAVKDAIDRGVAGVVGIPESVSLVVGDFFRTRLQLNKGKVPLSLQGSPDQDAMRTYALRLRSELDTFLGGRGRHGINVLFSDRGVCATIRLRQEEHPLDVQVRRADQKDAEDLEGVLRAAERQVSQWMYTRRSVRVFDGDVIHLIKPPRRLEWTETNAMLDADDIIAEILEARRSHHEP